MSEILLQELSNSDISWMMQVGCHIEIDEKTVLHHQSEALYILLEGVVAVHLMQPDRTSTHPVTQEFMQLSSGEMVGTIPLLNYLPAALITTKTRSLLLKIPRSSLQEKLEQEVRFAAHFYRACAVMLAQRLKALSHRIGCHPAILAHMQLKEAAMVFAELQDSDLDWLIAVGTVRSLPANTALVPSGKPVDELHILLEGAASLTLAEGQSSLITKAFSIADPSESEAEFARLSRGDWVGELLFMEAHSLAVTVKTLRETQILSIPRWRLAAKLLHDAGFAARFYRVLAASLANKQQAVIQRLGFDAGTTELSNQFLTRVALAEARFEWMLKRIQTQRGSEILW